MHAMDGPDSARGIQELRGLLLRRAIGSTIVFLFLFAVFALPFSIDIWSTAMITLFGAVFMVALPWMLQKRYGTRVSSLVFLLGGAALALSVYWFGRGVYTPAVALQVGVVVHAGVLLERNRMLWLASLFMAADLAKILLEQRGWDLPLYLPGTPLSAWAAIALTMVWLTPVLFYSTQMLEQTVERLQKQLAEVKDSHGRLLQAEELRDSISETAPVGILVFDHRGRNIFANSFAIARLGEEVRGCHRDRLPWPLTDHAGTPFSGGQSPFDRVGFTRRPVYGEPVAVERPVGRRIYFSLSVAPLGGIEGGTVVAFEDVSQRVEMEGRQLHAQRLASMGEMAGFLAHDFNNFLTVIRGDSQLMLTRAQEPADQTRLQRILKTSDHAAAVCRQLLTFARRDETQAYPLSVSALIEEHTELLSSVLPAKVEVIIDTLPDVPVVLAEASLLLQVLLNLVVNARDAMPQGGRLTLKTMRSTSGNGAMLVVEDTGTGMDEDTLRAIFDPYFTTKPAGSGTGLGLAIVYGVVQQLQGWIRVDSHPGQGTRFLIHLPAAPVPEAA
jgi:signal transduction histidine kinase